MPEIAAARGSANRRGDRNLDLLAVLVAGSWRNAAFTKP
jgi:hypothetical protein